MNEDVSSSDACKRLHISCCKQMVHASFYQGLGYLRRLYVLSFWFRPSSSHGSEGFRHTEDSIEAFGSLNCLMPSIGSL